MKRLFIATVLMCIIALIVHFDTPDYEWETASYTVQRGDTLWSICAQHCPYGVDIREYIHLVKEENGMESSRIYAGDEITMLIPREKGVNR